MLTVGSVIGKDARLYLQRPCQVSVGKEEGVWICEYRKGPLYLAGTGEDWKAAVADFMGMLAWFYDGLVDRPASELAPAEVELRDTLRQMVKVQGVI